MRLRLDILYRVAAGLIHKRKGLFFLTEICFAAIAIASACAVHTEGTRVARIGSCTYAIPRGSVLIDAVVFVRARALYQDKQKRQQRQRY